MERQLYRSKGNRMLAGVCGGVAEYFGIDPTVVRLIWVLVTLTYGVGLIAYIIAAIVIPERGYDSYTGSQEQYSSGSYDNAVGPDKPAASDNKLNIIIGGALVVLGALAITRRYIHIDLSLLWPLILIVIGAFIIYNGWGRKR